MFRFGKKRKSVREPEEGRRPRKSGGAKLETVRAGLDSRWFRNRKFSILKELEGKSQAKGLIDDKSRERAIASILGSLEVATEAFAADNDREGLASAADLFLVAYAKIGNPKLLDSYMDVCTKAGMTEGEITEKLVDAADKSNQIDIIVTLYAKARAKEKLIGAGHRALDLYLETNEMDMHSKTRLFDYIVEAYRSADDRESLIQAGDKALKNQIESRCLSRDEGWVLDAQKAYEACNDMAKLTTVGDQYVNLYLKEGLEVWLDKSIAAYREADVDFASKLGKLAGVIEEKGRSGIADTIRRKAGLL